MSIEERKSLYHKCHFSYIKESKDKNLNTLTLQHKLIQNIIHSKNRFTPCEHISNHDY